MSNLVKSTAAYAKALMKSQTFTIKLKFVISENFECVNDTVQINIFVVVVGCYVEALFIQYCSYNDLIFCYNFIIKCTMSVLAYSCMHGPHLCIGSTQLAFGRNYVHRKLE